MVLQTALSSTSSSGPLGSPSGEDAGEQGWGRSWPGDKAGLSHTGLWATRLSYLPTFLREVETYNSTQPLGLITAAKWKRRCWHPDRSNYIFKETLPTWEYWLHLVNDSAIQTVTMEHESLKFQYFLPNTFLLFFLFKHQKTFKAKQIQSITFFISLLAVGPPRPYFSNFWCATASVTCLWGQWAGLTGGGVWVTETKGVSHPRSQPSTLSDEPKSISKSYLLGTDLLSLDFPIHQLTLHIRNCALK